MIQEVNKTDSIIWAALSIQVWLHTYASEGIRKEILSFVINTFTEEYFYNILSDSNYRIWVFIKQNHLVGYIKAKEFHNIKGIDLFSQLNNSDWNFRQGNLHEK